jgi:integrase
MSMKQAKTFNVFLENLCAAARGAKVIENATADWLAELDDTMHARLAKLGIVKPRERINATLDRLLTAFFETLAVKPGTATTYKQTRTSLEDHFGGEKPLSDITPLECDRWRQVMRDAKLAEATISKRVKTARQIFRQGVRWKMLAENPFADVKAGNQTNKARMHFVSHGVAQQVLDACPDVQWKLLFALSRYGGLRCPSEHLMLKWSHVDWEKNRLLVHSPKTEHHNGADRRFVPLFPELRPYLLDAFSQAEEGAEHVITRCRDSKTNHRTQMERFIKRAGVKPWPKLFHNLRSTRQTELTEKFPSHVVCAWLGNSRAVAQDHYLQVTDAHFAQAVAEPQNRPKQAAHNPAQSTAVSNGNDRYAIHASNEDRPELPSDTSSSRYLHDMQVTPTGFEPVSRP